MGAKPLFCLPNNQMRIFYFLKISMKEIRNRDKERKIQREWSTFLMKGVNL